MKFERVLVGLLLIAGCCGMLASCSPSSPAWAAQGAANAPAPATAPDAGTPAATEASETKTASRTPPRLPRSPRLACSKDSDCTIVPNRPCTCPVCGTAWHEVLNKHELNKLEAMWAKERCVRRQCPTCESHLLGSKAVCHAGQCAVE